MSKRGRGRPPKKEPWKPVNLDLEHEVVASVVGIILLAFSVVVALAYTGIASGWVAAGIKRGLELLFGMGAFLAPLILAIAALYILLSHKPKVIPSALIGGTLVLASLLGILEIFGESSSQSGGWVGFFVAWPFYKAIGFWGALVIFIAAFVSGLLITFRIPLKSYAREAFVLGENGEQKLSTVVEKGLISTITGAARKITKPKLSPPKPADETVKVNTPGTSPTSTSVKKNGAEAFGFTITPALKDYTFPPISLLEEEKGSPVSGDIKSNALIIQRTLENFGIPVEMAEVNIGPSVTQFTLKPATGVKLSKLVVLSNDLALALAAHPIRIEAPIPGKSLVGIEIPNKSSMLVRLRAMLEELQPNNKDVLSFATGKDVAGEPYWASLARMPHLLVAGATGTGKSVAINSMLISFLYRHAPDTLRLILVDPKRVELTLYNGIPHLLTPVITEPKKAVAALKWAVSEMERRYGVFQEARVRDIASYNEKELSKKNGEPMPYIVVLIDELADLMASYGREIEGAIVRLAQMARAIGIHLVVSTQRPSVEVITGLIKANITSRVAFQVASQVDSRTILDSSGAEKLLGRGDMLFMGPDFAKPKRFQGTYVSDQEVKKVVDFLKKNMPKTVAFEDQGSDQIENMASNPKSQDIDLDRFSQDEGDYDDELLLPARELVIEAGKASASMLQRRLRVGYARAARLLDMLEDRGVIGPADGAKPREVFIEPDDPLQEEESREGFI